MIFQEYPPKPEKQEPTVTFRLIPYKDHIEVHAVDEDGTTVASGHLLSIYQEGVDIPPGVNPRLGFKLNADQSLNIIKED